MKDAVGRLKRYARRRVQDPEEESLTCYVQGILQRREDSIFDDLLVPEKCAFGASSDVFEQCYESERLALNHWAYYLQYTKISDGERFLLVVNALIADLLEPGAPDIANLLRRESLEEQDHISAFGFLGKNIGRYHGFDHIRFPSKPLRQVFVSRRFCQWLTNYFGADFLVTYFLGRGIANHLGKGFELAVAATGSSTNHSLHYLSHLHSLHEHHHTGVSHLLSSCAHQVLEQEEKRGALYDILVRLMHRVSVWSTFAATPTRRTQARMSRQALQAMPVFADRDPDFIGELVAAHFTAVNGIEAAQSAHMPRFNAKLLRNAELRLEHKQNWVDDLARDAGHQSWFPPCWQLESENSEPRVEQNPSRPAQNSAL